MYWRVTCEERADGAEFEGHDGRFVLHRHHDADGPHLDLRLEHDGYLMGWRIDSVSFEDESWATEKAPHPATWLERDADAACVDAGVYRWVERNPNQKSLLLKGHNGILRVSVTRQAALPPEAARAICQTLQTYNVNPRGAAQMIADGVAARRRAVERLCGLGRELDGSAFDDTVWHKILAGLSLEDVHAQLRAYEVRFDLKYPPSAVSRPAAFPESEDADRSGRAMALARE